MKSNNREQTLLTGGRNQGAGSEGPQHIGARKSFVVVPAHVWAERETPRQPLGPWLVENTPRGTNLEIPARRDYGLEIPFIDQVDA